MSCFKGCCDFLRPRPSHSSQPIETLPLQTTWSVTAKKAYDAAGTIESYKETVSYRITPRTVTNHFTPHFSPMMGVAAMSMANYPCTPAYHEEVVPYNTRISTLISKVKIALEQYAFFGFEGQEFTVPGPYNSSANTVKQIFDDILNATIPEKPASKWSDGIKEIRLDVRAHPNKSPIHQNFLKFIDETLVPLVIEANRNEEQEKRDEGAIQVQEEPLLSEFEEFPQGPSLLQLTNLSSENIEA